MSEKTAANIPTETTDASARYLPENVKNDGLMRLDGIVWDKQQKESVIKWIKALWAALKPKILEETGVEIPNFQEEMVQWVQFEGRERPEGDHDPTTGVIRINTLTADEQNVASTVAHELFHFIARRLLLKRKETTTPVRSGLRVIGHTLVGKPDTFSREQKGWADGIATDESLEFKAWSFALLDEAVVETTSKRILQSVASEVPHIENVVFTPTFYSEARRFYSTLIKNLVLAWNDPTLRTTEPHVFKFEGTHGWQATQSEEWKNRILKLKTELGFGDVVTEEDIQKVFEEAMYKKNSLHKLSHLINTLLGDGAYKEIYRLSSGLNPAHLSELEHQHHVKYTQLWELITRPAETALKKIDDVTLKLASETIQITKGELPQFVSLISLERRDGTHMGVKDIFKEYEKLMDNPISQSDLLLFASVSQPDLTHTSDAYPYSFGMVHNLKTRRGAFARGRDKTMTFCFEKLCETLQINLETPQQQEKKTILHTEFSVDYFSVPKKPGILLANVSITKNGKTDTYCYFVTSK